MTQKQHNRLFIGLDLAAKDKISIDEWRTKFLRGLPGNPVPMENFHITLSFLGQVDDKQFERLDELLSDIKHPTFSLQMTDMGYFTKPKVLYIETSLPSELQALATDCMQVNKSLGLKLHHDRYRPHISLYRKHPVGFPFEGSLPSAQLHFEQFHLFRSVSSQKPGQPPSYPIIKSYDLLPKFHR